MLIRSRRKTGKRQSGRKIIEEDKIVDKRLTFITDLRSIYSNLIRSKKKRKRRAENNIFEKRLNPSFEEDDTYSDVLIKSKRRGNGMLSSKMNKEVVEKFGFFV